MTNAQQTLPYPNLLKIEEAARRYFEDRHPRSKHLEYMLCLALYGPGPRPECPDDGKTYRGEHKGASFDPGFFPSAGQARWYCPAHGAVGEPVTIEYMVEHREAAL